MDVKAFDRLGNKISIPQEQVPELEKLGGRVASSEELREHALEQAYEHASTAEKLAGIAGLPGGVRSPELEAFENAGKAALSAGLHQAAVRKGIEIATDTYGRGEISGKKAGDAYAQRIDDLARMSPVATTAGTVGGIVGGIALGAAGGSAGGVSRALPMNALAELGAPVEHVVARGLGGLAARGAGGRALSTGLSMGARAAVEGGAYAGIEEASREVLHDEPINGEKLFAAVSHGALYGAALGAGLGASGSLAASGVRYVKDRFGSWLADKLASKAAAGADEAALGARRAIAEEAAEGPRARFALGQGDALAPRPTITGEGVAEGAPIPKKAPVPEEMAGEVVGKPPPPEPFSTRADRHARQVANDLAWDSLNTTRKVSDKVNAKVEGGTNAVGDYINRRIAKNRDPRTIADLLEKSRADELLPIIESELAADGRKIGELVATYNVRVPLADVVDPARALAREMSKDPTRIQGVAAFQERIEQMFKAFSNASQIGADQTMSLSDLYYARAKMEGVAHELNRGSAAHDSFKTYLRKVDDLLVNKLDEAAKAAGTNGGAEIRALKREYQLGSWAKRAAEDGTNRIIGNNIIGLRGGAAGFAGIATGHVLGGLGTMLASKVMKERGAAVGAYVLSQAAERGYVRKAVEAFDAKVKSAAQSVLKEGPRARPEVKKGPGRPKKENPVSGREAQKQTVREGQAIVKWAAKLRANPDDFRKGLEDSAAVITEAAGPKTADAWVSTALRAVNFVIARVPSKPILDPLDASSAPPLTHDEADRLVRAFRYATQPMAVWEDLEQGIVTADTVEAAKTFMPEAWQDFQMHLYGHLEEQLARNVQLSQSQRLRVYRILGVPAGADMRPEMVKRYQVNFSSGGAPAGAPKGGGGKPVDLKVGQSSLDRVESRASGG